MMKMVMLRIYSKNMVMGLLALLMKRVQNWRMNWRKDIRLKPAEYYSGIDDMPLDNWDKCINGELKYVRKTDGKSDDESDSDAWAKIYDSYINEFGLNKTYLKLLNAMKKRAILECDFVVSGDRFHLTKIDMEIATIEQIISNAGVGGMSIDETLIYISKWMGVWLNKKRITTREYFNLLANYGKANKK